MPLEGPAYFVSHGGEAFPSLIMVLQGYGVTVDLVGAHVHLQSGDHEQHVQDGPRRPGQQLRTDLPEGKYSALAANGNLCTSKLAMPTAFTAQNGAEIHESTKIAVTGCAEAEASFPFRSHRQKHRRLLDSAIAEGGAPSRRSRKVQGRSRGRRKNKRLRSVYSPRPPEAEC